MGISRSNVVVVVVEVEGVVIADSRSAEWNLFVFKSACVRVYVFERVGVRMSVYVCVRVCMCLCSTVVVFVFVSALHSIKNGRAKTRRKGEY
jgi:hypothetical protein